MIIAQISDLHIGFAGQGETCKNTDRLNKVINSLHNFIRPPDLVLATGDLVELGELWAYRDLKKALRKLKIPVHMALGNHDNRESFLEVFPEYSLVDGYLQYTLEDGPVRIIVLDTLEEGRHGGSFCETRAEWLEARLAEQPHRPTLIALHHPPIKTGIGWLTSDPNAPWVKRLHNIISRYDNVKHMVAGHIHRNIYKSFAGTNIAVTAAIAPQSKLELAEIDPEKPDGRPMLVEASPGFCLHHWDGGEFTTHSATSPCGKVLFHYEEKFAYVVRHTLDLDD